MPASSWASLFRLKPDCDNSAGLACICAFAALGACSHCQHQRAKDGIARAEPIAGSGPYKQILKGAASLLLRVVGNSQEGPEVKALGFVHA